MPVMKLLVVNEKEDKMLKCQEIARRKVGSEIISSSNLVLAYYPVFITIHHV